jgi:nucleoside-diphosphate-sugar epimerase
VNSQVFNIGFNEKNYRIHDLAAIIQKALPGSVEVLISRDQVDTRSYRVNFDKFANTFGAKPEMTVADGALEVWSALDKGHVFDAPDTITVKWYKNLIDTQRFLRSIELNGEIL